MCAASATTATYRIRTFRHESLHRHRQIAAVAASAPRRGCVRADEHRRSRRSAAAHSTLTLPMREVGDPDLPRNANALGFETRGRFVFGVRKGLTFPWKSAVSSRPRSIRALARRRGDAVEAPRGAVPGCFGTGGAVGDRNALGACARTDWRLATDANAKHRANVTQRRGFRSRPVRAALPWRMPRNARRCFDNDVSSVRIEQRT